MEEQRNREERKEDGKQRRYKESGKEVMQGKGKKDAAAKARFVALCGMMTALAFLFDYVETLIPISLAGSCVSLILMILVRQKNWFSPVGVSILGGVGHNVGQLAVAAAVLESRTLFYYLPVLLIAGMAAGAVIGILCGRMVKRLVSLPDLR